MTYDELLAKLNAKSDSDEVHALRAVLELHKPSIKKDGDTCECDVYDEYMMGYPCKTIQAIQSELG